LGKKKGSGKLEPFFYPQPASRQTCLRKRRRI
jgi:hypothetical protein